MTIFFNYCFDKRRFSNFLQWFFRKSGHKKLLQLLEKLKFVGFHSATEAGFSISIDDLKIPDLKSTILLNGASKIKDLTPIENYQKIIELWNFTNETLKSQVLQSFQISDFLNPVYLMAFSGARGNISQIRQLVGMRGLMADPQGQIIDFPIRSNFREGLTLTEYLISCSGARKGIVDTALRTAASGYLTRRLVDIAHHAIISQIDCKSEKGFLLESLYDQKKKILSLEQRLIGRILAETIIIPENSKLIGKKNQEISKTTSIKICNYRTKVLIRSPLTCLSSKFICQLCYGWNLAEGQLVSIGEAVGILAAQSIGEPGTQLTMRTFHTGGVFTGTLMDQTYSPSAGYAIYPLNLSGLLIRTQQGQIAYLTKNSGVLKIQQSQEFKQLSSNLKRLLYLNAGELGSIRGKNPFLINIFQTMENKKQKNLFFVFQTSTVLYVRQGEQIRKNQLLAEVPFFSHEKTFEKEQEVLSRSSGEIYFENVVFFEKTIFDLSKYLIQNLSEFWILFGQIISTNKFFFKKLDLIAGYLPFNQIELPYFFSNSTKIQIYFKKISYYNTKNSIQNKWEFVFNENSVSLKFIGGLYPGILSPLQPFGRRSPLWGEQPAEPSWESQPLALSSFAAKFRGMTAAKFFTSNSYFFVNRQGFLKQKCIKNFSILYRAIFKVHNLLANFFFFKKSQILQNWSANWLRVQQKNQPKIVHWKNIPLQRYLFIINFLQKKSYPNTFIKYRVNFKSIGFYSFIRIPIDFQIIQRQFFRSRKIQILVRFFKYFQNSEIIDLRISQNNFLFSTLSDSFSQYSNISKLGSLIRDPRGGQQIAQIKNISLYRKATNYLLNHQSILYGQYGNLISKNQRLCTVFYSQPKTGDIVQGIPKIEEILEVRKVLPSMSMFFKDFLFSETYLQNLQKSVLNNIQRIYGGQGIYISDKHIEIIVRQMTSNALILEPGQTGLLCGEMVALQWIEKINLTLISNKVTYEPILMGMTQTCLEMSSFLSAASFQETTRVLSRAALQNQIDFIRGIKQNVILGNLIPIGTGCF
uniref:RNA polymerase beta'' subunit n=1 Tax=Halimeda opuntia TaxID=118223 RepID=UPI0021141AFF|nr:RNA polymerase beta'' subunit [Halimeda opuntia]UTN43207.1 RNA polymerase beta'' subunit [Halimeda opuntia]